MPELGYGSFTPQEVNFLILAFIIFLIVRAATKVAAKPEAAPAEPTAEPADVALLAAQITSNTELVYGTWDAEPVTQDLGSPYDEAIDSSDLA